VIDQANLSGENHQHGSIPEQSQSQRINSVNDKGLLLPSRSFVIRIAQMRVMIYRLGAIDKAQA
jgi:hypothetical protein